MIVSDEELDTATGELPVPMTVVSTPRQCQTTQIKRGRRQTDSSLHSPPRSPHRTSFISCSLLTSTSNGDAGSITRGTGHSWPCSPTKHPAWHQDRSPEVHPHALGPQVFIFPTGNTSHPGVIYPTIVLSNEDHCRSIFRLAHRTYTCWGNDDSSLFPQCRTPREIERSSHSANLLDASETGGWPPVRSLSSSEGAGSYPSFRVPGRVRNRTELPLFPTHFPKPCRQCPDCPPRIYGSGLGIRDQRETTCQDGEAQGDSWGEEDEGDG